MPLLLLALRIVRRKRVARCYGESRRGRCFIRSDEEVLCCGEGRDVEQMVRARIGRDGGVALSASPSASPSSPSCINPFKFKQHAFRPKMTRSDTFRHVHA